MGVPTRTVFDFHSRLTMEGRSVVLEVVGAEPVVSLDGVKR